MTEGGDPDKLGRGCIWRAQIDGCIHQNHVFRVRVNRSRLLPEFLLAVLRTRYAKCYFFQAAKRSSNLASINSTQVKKFTFPLPSMEMQRKFLLRVDRWDKAVGQSTEAIHLAQRVFSALSSRAFTGELTGEYVAANGD
jgi:type I restriction enzyme, S subunit